MLLFDFRLYAALIGAVLFAAFLNVFSYALVSPAPANPPGFALPTSAAAAKPAETKVVPLPELLAKADPAQGKTLAKVCATCHVFDKGAAPKVGPNLYGVVGRPKGSTEFAYSDAMKAKGGNWTFADLDAFITSPKSFVPGTKMGFGGEPKAEKRAEIIAYLRSLSDNPVPLPAN